MGHEVGHANEAIHMGRLHGCNWRNVGCEWGWGRILNGICAYRQVVSDGGVWELRGE